MKVLTVFSVAVLLGASACSSHMGERERAGTLLGGVIGGVAGSAIGEGDGQLVAVGAGTLLGAIIGGEIGRSLDEADRRFMAEATGRALEYSRSNTALDWRNPDTGHSGSVTPLNVMEGQNTYCREFQQTVTIGGHSQDAYGTACRQPDGSWRLVNS